jgi:hypothetical protein
LLSPRQPSLAWPVRRCFKFHLCDTCIQIPSRRHDINHTPFGSKADHSPLNLRLDHLVVCYRSGTSASQRRRRRYQQNHYSFPPPSFALFLRRAISRHHDGRLRLGRVCAPDCAHHRAGCSFQW